MKIVLSGASGFLGRAISAELAQHGHELTVLVRRPPAAANEVEWHPDRGELDPAAISGVDCVLGLSGAGIADKRWNTEYKRLLVDSRVAPTKTIADTIAGLDPHLRPEAFVTASAIGFYGERGDQPLPETAAAGDGFLAGLVQAWEAATAPAAAAGVRVAFLRTGLVLSAGGGLLAKLIPLFKGGLGGKLGSGMQYQSWITLADEIAAVRYVLESDLSGAVNLVGPAPVRNAEFSRCLGEVLHRPAVFPTPAFGLRLVLGEFANEGVLTSQRVIPEALSQHGYAFRHSELKAALEWAVAH